TLGADHPDTIAGSNYLAQLLLEQQKWAEAVALFREALDRRRKALPEGHPLIADSLVGLGQGLSENGQAVEAEPLLRKAYEIRQTELGGGDRPTAEAGRLLGASLSCLARLQEAEPLLLKGYETLSRAKGVPPVTVQRAVDRLVRLYEASEQREKAN